ncbi:monovalent cation/H(+) antiporter subunit G [Lysinibacter cavernae]|uniref:Multicomponent Na+:H+ antiporter subunit G n=1 Tax=Lysinibacter cavernae TaxID=1640652 RepID=A0A7X5R174_9MICO|nr:monovalent cation/H(+) antiporter subunit G [Lysinibacter cavernae]NIH53713.1 multicomponent Na+:H+ antiporter subunit G [Lysinibacter cavernae]
MWESIRDVLSVILLIFGSFLSVAAGIGILRFPDVLSRLHAGTKPQILGLTSIMFAVVLQNMSWPTASGVAVVLVIQYLTQPISAHLVGRSGYRSDYVDKSTLIADELAPEVAAHDTDDPEQDNDKVLGNG